ncbi:MULTISPECIES: helix-turn-helix domain-containing protein [Burkholderia cepacia complex]|uniref:helix-turn-helix domain-containing protein n=1 Tax=Burkholderia cepacia complex TaxID=87882 RepID=UPI000D1A686A|nr:MULTISPECIES: helix-turn-helix domain-containing protein [Burkholderia cepacia complex]MDN7873833.1 helix-turn-helix domain-containing protein [Burkholderia aenigmatica]RQT96083.1 helix-turn-helix domain-containing protein [Burkholderia cenocepacia]
MKTTIEWLDAVKARLDLPSDYAAAKVLGVTRQRVSAWRNGRQTFEDEVCLQVAEILGIDPFEVLANVKIERSTDEARRAVWTRALEKFSEGFRTLVLRANARQTTFCRV